jgi:hypothetical protein
MFIESKGMKEMYNKTNAEKACRPTWGSNPRP